MRTVILIGALVLSLSTYGQEVVSTQGESYTNVNGSIDFTIGEVVINTVSDGTNDLTQGFHQTNWNFLGVDDHEQSLDATVFPNPMGSELHIQTASYENLTYVLYDAAGRIVAEEKLGSTETSIDVSAYAPSSYSLVLRNENQEKVKTFKLVKTH